MLFDPRRLKFMTELTGEPVPYAYEFRRLNQGHSGMSKQHSWHYKCTRIVGSLQCAPRNFETVAQSLHELMLTGFMYSRSVIWMVNIKTDRLERLLTPLWVWWLRVTLRRWMGEWVTLVVIYRIGGSYWSLILKLMGLMGGQCLY